MNTIPYFFTLTGKSDVILQQMVSVFLDICEYPPHAVMCIFSFNSLQSRITEICYIDKKHHLINNEQFTTEMIDV